MLIRLFFKVQICKLTDKNTLTVILGDDGSVTSAIKVMTFRQGRQKRPRKKGVAWKLLQFIWQKQITERAKKNNSKNCSLQIKLQFINVDVWKPLPERNCIVTMVTIQYNALLAITGAVRGTWRVGLESLRQKRWFCKLCTFYKMYKKQSKLYLYDSTTPVKSSRITRPSKNIPCFHFEHKFFKTSFFPSAITEWENLDISIR